MKEYKVLFVIEDANLSGGTEIQAFNLLDSLNARGITSILLSIKPYYKNNKNVISLSELDYARWKRVQRSFLNKVIGGGLADDILSSFIKENALRFNVKWVISHTYDLIGAIPCNEKFRTAQIFNWSICGYESSLMLQCSKKPIPFKFISEFFFRTRFIRWHNSLTKHSKLIVLTNSARKELKRINSSISEPQIVTIPNPLMAIEDSSSVTSLNNRKIVFVGRLSPEKGVMRLLRIWENIYLKLQDYSLLIYGEGPAKSEMAHFIKSHSLPRVFLKGYCNDKSSIFTGSDLLLMTSDTEGFGLVLIEAMYYGVPSVSFDCPVSPKEIIADTGVIIPCFDEQAYGKAVIKILEDKDSLVNLQQRCLTRVRSYYIDIIINKWNNLFG